MVSLQLPEQFQYTCPPEEIAIVRAAWPHLSDYDREWVNSDLSLRGSYYAVWHIYWTLNEAGIPLPDELTAEFIHENEEDEYHVIQHIVDLARTNISLARRTDAT